MGEITENVFSVVDCIVLGGMITISVFIGVFFAYRDKNDHTTKNYFLGGQNMQSIPVALSFVVTFQSSILIIGIPGESYGYGMQYCLQGFGIMAAYFLATVIVVPVFHPLKVTTTYQYYNIRFGDNYVRSLAFVCGTIHYTFYMGLVMFGTGLALESAAGIPSWASILILSIAAIIYTAVGGLKSVIWTDVFQSLVMIVGILAVLIKCTVKSGGLIKVLELSRNRLNILDFNPDPLLRHTFWTLVIGGFSHFLYFTVSQASIQRINSTKTVKAANRLFYFAGPGYTAIFFLVMMQGLAIFAYFTRQGCDPLASGKIDNVNMIIPFTIVELFHDSPGVPGLFLAALSAASLSTISSGLSCLSAMTYEDCIKLLPVDISDRTGTAISKIVVVVYGLLSIGFAFLLSNIKSPLGRIMPSLMGAIMGPETGLYLCCVFYRKATSKGVFVGMLTGISLVLWISVGQNFIASVTKAPYLPLGPTNTCFVTNSSHLQTNDSFYVYNQHRYISYSVNATGRTIESETGNNTGFHLLINYTGSDDVMQSHDHLTKYTVHTGRDKWDITDMYSISYMYFNLIGSVTTILVGVLVSICTQPKGPIQINRATILPLSVLLPSCCISVYRRLTSKNREPLDTLQETNHELLPKA